MSVKELLEMRFSPAATCKSCGLTFDITTGHVCPGLRPLDPKALKVALIEANDPSTVVRSQKSTVQSIIRAYLDAREPSGYLFQLRYTADHWSQVDMYSATLPDNPDDVRNVRPLYL